MNTRAKEIISNNTAVFTVPEVYAELSKKLQDPYASNSQLASIIQLDAGLSSSLLRVVNSAFYGFPSSISTITQAISIIGRAELGELVLGTSTINVFQKLAIPDRVLRQHWKHSLLCGLIARNISKHSDDESLSPETLFTAGLLHDIGRLVLWQQFPDESGKLLSKEPVSDITEQEQQLYDTDHAEVGHALLSFWKLPEILPVTAAYHHHPENSPTYANACEIIAVANQAAKIELHQTDFRDDAVQALNNGKLALQAEKLAECIDISHQQLKEVGAMFL